MITFYWLLGGLLWLSTGYIGCIRISLYRGQEFTVGDAIMAPIGAIAGPVMLLASYAESHGDIFTKVLIKSKVKK